MAFTKRIGTGVRASIAAPVLAFFCISANAAPQCIPVTESELKIVRESFATVLFDSESARFRDVCRNDRGPDSFFCGLLNAKNRYSAFIGFEPFFAKAGAAGHVHSDAMSVGEEMEFRIFHCYACTDRALKDCR